MSSPHHNADQPDHDDDSYHVKRKEETADARENGDRLLPLGVFSRRQEAVSYLLRMGMPAPIANTMDEALANLIADEVGQHVVKAADGTEQHWLQAWGSKLIRIDVTDEKDSSTVLFVLRCARCKKDAVFTSEGPNDEYPEPLCALCEEGTE